MTKTKKISKKELALLEAQNAVIETATETNTDQIADTNIETQEIKNTNAIINSFPKLHIDILNTCIKNNKPALLIGHTGLGKTTLIKELAKEQQKELERISVHSGVTADEIIGKWLAENGSTVWQDGVLVEAMKKGKWIVFDEINACPADVLFALHSLLDDDRHIKIIEKNGEIIKPHADFRFFATMNPPDDYAGTKEMNMAFLSRFNAVVYINTYPQSVEIEILKSKGITIDTATKLVNIATQLRVFKHKEEIQFFCGTRDIINTGIIVDGGVPIQDAIKFGIVNKMNIEDQEYVKNKLDITYKTEEQKEIERLSNELQNIEKEKNKYIQLSKELTKQLNDKTTSNNGNVFVDEKTQKALKILGVLKQNNDTSSI